MPLSSILQTHQLETHHRYTLRYFLLSKVQEQLKRRYKINLCTLCLLMLTILILIIQVVRGLGETLVGAYPGRALSFVCRKSDLKSPKVHILNILTIIISKSTIGGSSLSVVFFFLQLPEMWRNIKFSLHIKAEEALATKIVNHQTTLYR